MIVGFNSPVKDITIIGKPLVWGYILLGNEYGLSWYWMSKLLLIILSAFEMCYILTKKNEKLSLLGSLLIGLSPFIQWWFAPHMPDVILYAMVLFDLMYYFFFTSKEYVKNIMIILIPITVMQYTVALFPSFQVGLGYFIVALFITVVLRDKLLIFKDKKHNIRLALILVLSILLVGYFVINNKNALLYESNTEYPGSRVDYGGKNTIKEIFTDLATPFLSYKEYAAPYKNQSEDSTYIHFGFFIIMLLPVLMSQMKKNKDRDYIVGYAFLGILSIYCFFMIFGFPKFLAKITLLSYINRMKMIVGFIMMVLTIWGFNVIEKTKEIDDKYYYLAVFTYAILLLSFIDNNLINYAPKYCYCTEIVLYACILLFLKNKQYNYGYSILLFILLFSSIAINPIAIGTSGIYNHPSASKIREIANNDKDAYWLGYDSIIYPSFLIANGAKVFNGLNVYPDFKKWEYIDPNDEYKEIWNRYAYIVTSLSDDGENHIKYYTNKDTLKLEINLETLDHFNVKYILTGNDLSSYKTNYIYLKEIYGDSNIKIYELTRN